MNGRNLSKRSAITIFATALLVRGAFALWAPEAGVDDGYFYWKHALRLVEGLGYANMDGSPAVQWAPGWPAVLALLITLFGSAAKVPFYASAVFGATTSLLVASLGSKFFGRRIGEVAGILYAFWPALIYYSATRFSEPFFALLFLLSLHLLVTGAGADRWRTALLVACGLCFGLSALVKAELLAMTPVLLLFLWMLRRSPADFLRTSALVFVTAAAVVTPWTLRNAMTFDRLIPVSANGGAVFYLANHPGATGSENIFFERRNAKRHKRPTRSQVTLARDEAGWRDGWQFIRTHPKEEMRIVLSKLRRTYLADDMSARIVRGFGKSAQGRVDRQIGESLVRIANAYWLTILVLSAIGLFVVPWSRESAVLLGGLVATWLCIHVVFLGGNRFRVPEAPVYALLAAGALVWLRDRLRAAPGTSAVP